MHSRLGLLQHLLQFGVYYAGREIDTGASCIVARHQAASHELGSGAPARNRLPDRGCDEAGERFTFEQNTLCRLPKVWLDTKRWKRGSLQGGCPDALQLRCIVASVAAGA